MGMEKVETEKDVLPFDFAQGRTSFSVSSLITPTALCKRMWYRVFVESRAERGSQQKLWFYLSAKRCIYLG